MLPDDAPLEANAAAAADATLTGPAATRGFGRFELIRLLGRSERTMSWLGVDRATALEAVLCMPRLPPLGADAIETWLQAARRAARLDHPNLATVAEAGVVEGWPFVAVDRRAGLTLDEWLESHAAPPIEEQTGWIADVLLGLAYAHDGGVAHLDLQRQHVLIDERGRAVVMALAVAGEAPASADSPQAAANERAMALDPQQLRAQRAAAERDVVACGVLLNGLLCSAPVLGLADLGHVLERMAPHGRELVRLPWTTPQPVPEALRAIVNRSTSSQLRLRYRSARTFHRALQGWREAAAGDQGGPVALLLDRLQSVGHLPALPGLALRVQRVLGIEGRRTHDIAQHLLPDMALCFELLRTLYSAQVQGTQVAGNGPVLTLRRVVALVGVDGVRFAANSLRQWPGPLDEAPAALLHRLFDRVRLAGHTAQALRPAGYDGEVVYLVAVLQNLGRLMLRYHFADEAEQMDQLMRPARSPVPPAEGQPAEEPGLSEQGAGFAVLGVEVESFAAAAARHFGFTDDVLHMIRRLPVDAPVRKHDSDADLLRMVASAANEAVDATSLPPRKVGAALEAVAGRYQRCLGLKTRALHDAVQDARDAMREGRAVPESGVPRTVVAKDDVQAPTASLAEVAR